MVCFIRLPSQRERKQGQTGGVRDMDKRVFPHGGRGMRCSADISLSSFFPSAKFSRGLRVTFNEKQHVPVAKEIFFITASGRAPVAKDLVT